MAPAGIVPVLPNDGGEMDDFASLALSKLIDAAESAGLSAVLQAADFAAADA